MNRTSDAVRSRASQLNILLGPQGRSNRWAEGEEMIEQLSLSIFTIEADRRPVLAFAAKKYEEADVFFRDERVRTKLRSASSAGVPLCDDLSILRIRLANAEERARYREKAMANLSGDPAAIFLIDVDRE